MRYYIKLCETFGDEGIRDLYGEVGGIGGANFQRRGLLAPGILSQATLIPLSIDFHPLFPGSTSVSTGSSHHHLNS